MDVGEFTYVRVILGLEPVWLLLLLLLLLRLCDSCVFSLLFKVEGCPPCVENMFRWLMDGLFKDSSMVEVYKFQGFGWGRFWLTMI